MANLIVEIGNTALKAAWAEESTLGKTFRYQGEKVMDFILSLVEKERPEVMTVASVREILKEEEDILRQNCGHLMIMDSVHTDFLYKYSLPEYLTYDRASSIVAARFLFKNKPCTVFDFGTTLTIDFIDSAGNYLGGNISPGCRTRFKSINRYSKSLPIVNTPSTMTVKGNSLESSVGAGVINGIIFEIEGYARQHQENIMIFTGGDAIYFAKRMKNSIFVVCNLVLIGLALITDDYVKKYL